MHFTLGAHAYLWTDRWSDQSLGILDRAAALGLGCFEIAAGDDVQFTPALTRSRAESLGLELILSPGGAWPMEADLSHDRPACRQFGLDWHQRMIDLASRIGAIAYCGAIYAHPGHVERRTPPADELPRTAEQLHRLAEYARQSGVKLILEPMSHFRTHLINTPAQAMHLIDLADHPNLYILLDTYHLVTELRNFADAIRIAAPRLWGIHACENDRGVPGGGLVPWREIFAALAHVPQPGYMLLETYNSTIPGFAHSRGMFHNVCPDPDAFTRQGLAFLSRMLAETTTPRDGDAPAEPR